MLQTVSEQVPHSQKAIFPLHRVDMKTLGFLTLKSQPMPIIQEKVSDETRYVTNLFK